MVMRRDLLQRSTRHFHFQGVILKHTAVHCFQRLRCILRQVKLNKTKSLGQHLTRIFRVFFLCDGGSRNFANV